MRNKEQKGDLTVQAIAGTHVVLLGMHFPKQECPGLLGFALRREDHTEGEKYWLRGYKTFKSVEPFPPPGMLYSTRQHPIQGFTWSDFSAKPEHDYTYEVFALRGTPPPSSRLLSKRRFVGLEVVTAHRPLPSHQRILSQKPVVIGFPSGPTSVEAFSLKTSSCGSLVILPSFPINSLNK